MKKYIQEVKHFQSNNKYFVVKQWKHSGVLLSKVGHFWKLLEETGFRLRDRGYLFDLIPFILEEEKQINKVSIQWKGLSVIFDSTVVWEIFDSKNISWVLATHEN